MSYGHVKPGDPINLQTLRDELDIDSSYALVKTERMEVIRMALAKGKTVEEHSVDSEISVLCLKGEIFFDINHIAETLRPDDWLYLNAGQPFSYSVKEETILLVTIVFDHR